ncbi:MAG: VOC family protein [Acidobacteriota bacterium]
MTETSKIRAVLFVKDLARMTTFYTEALSLEYRHSDGNHAILQRGEFELLLQQIPDHIAVDIEISEPPVRRESGAIRLDYPVESIDRSRSAAKGLGGGINEEPAWVDQGARFYLGYDPEGNVLGVSESAV